MIKPVTRSSISPLAGLAARQWLLLLLILAGLVLIGLPLTARTQGDNTRQAVSEDLMTVVAAREHFALEHNITAGTTVTVQQLLSDGKYLKAMPLNLIGREIRLGPVGGRVACKLDGAWYDPLPTLAHPQITPDVS